MDMRSQLGFQYDHVFGRQRRIDQSLDRQFCYYLPHYSEISTMLFVILDIL